MLLKIEPLRPFNSSWYPYAGKLGLTPVALAGSVRLRQESPYDPPLEVSSVVIRVICSHGLHGSRATLFQSAHTLHSSCPPNSLAHADLPFRIVVPPLVDAPGILSLGAYGVAWHIDALVYGSKSDTVLLNRSIRLQLDRYAPRPHALPPVSTSPPHAPLPNGYVLNARLSRSIYCATDSITATIHLSNSHSNSSPPPSDAILLRLHAKLIRRISVRPDTSSPKIQDSRSFATFKIKQVPLPTLISLRIPPPANRYRYSVGESSRTEYAHIEFYISIKATVKIPGSSSPVTVQIEPVPFTLLSVDRSSLDAAKHHARRYYLAQSPEIKNICNAPRSINHVAYPDSSCRGDLNHYPSEDYQVPEFLSDDNIVDDGSIDSSSNKPPLHTNSSSTESVSDHGLDIHSKKLRPTTASTITQANYRHKNPRHTTTAISTPAVSSPLSPHSHHPLASTTDATASPTTNTFSDKSSVSGLTSSSSVPPSPASTISSLENGSSNENAPYRAPFDRYPHLSSSAVSDAYSSASEDDSDSRRSKLKSHVARLVHSSSSSRASSNNNLNNKLPQTEHSPYGSRPDQHRLVGSSDLLVLPPHYSQHHQHPHHPHPYHPQSHQASSDNGSSNGHDNSNNQGQDLGETLGQKNSSRSSLLGALNIARWSRTKLVSTSSSSTATTISSDDNENELSLPASSSLPVSLSTMDQQHYHHQPPPLPSSPPHSPASMSITSLTQTPHPTIPSKSSPSSSSFSIVKKTKSRWFTNVGIGRTTKSPATNPSRTCHQVEV